MITDRVAETVTAKGKTEPVPAREALEARSRFGVDLASAKRTPLVGRTHELGVHELLPVGVVVARTRWAPVSGKQASPERPVTCDNLHIMFSHRRLGGGE